ncbi:MAG TPA: DinB family protein [Jatrophihabitantaceae bacterium]
MERIDESYAADERGTLEGILERQRATLLWKCAGLNGEQLAQRAVPPSKLSLLGLVRHLADAERAWFRRYLRGEQLPEVYRREDCPDAAFEEASAEGAEADFARLTKEWELCRKAAAGAALDDTFLHEQVGFLHEQVGPISLRWIYVHMIEEYARHNGHADLLRECVDGVTGE